MFGIAAGPSPLFGCAAKRPPRARAFKGAADAEATPGPPAASEPASGGERHSWKRRAGDEAAAEASRERRKASAKARVKTKEREVPLGEIAGLPVLVHEKVEVADRMETVSTPGAGAAGGPARPAPARKPSRTNRAGDWTVAGRADKDTSGRDDDGIVELNGVRASGRRGRATVPLSPPPPPTEPEPEVVGLARRETIAAGTVVFAEADGVVKAAKEKFDDGGRSVRAGRSVRGPVPKRPAKKTELEAARQRSAVPMVAIVKHKAPGRPPGLQPPPGRPPRDCPGPDLGRPDVPDRRRRTEGKLARLKREYEDRNAVAAGRKLKAARKAYGVAPDEGEKKREHREEQRRRSDVDSPRAIAAARLLGGEPEEAEVPAAEEAGQPTAPEAEQQFLELSQDEAQAIEKQAEAKLKAQIEAARGPEAPVAVAVEEFKPDETEEAPAPVREAAAAGPLPPVNPFVMTAKDRFSTFAMDVDTASYTIARKYIRGGYRPPARLVRMEEFVNAFDYNYPKRSRDVFDIQSDGMPSPFGKDLQLLKIGVKSRVVGREGRKPAHLVFVIDASGSMERPDRMPLVKYALSLLVGELAPQDIVTAVAYGTQPSLIFEGVSASMQAEIVSAMRSLQCGGSTNMIAGLRLGYEQAKRRFRTGAVNRVILCSDGVANVGVSEAEEILKEIETYRDWGVTLTVAGFGAGSYDDKLLEKLADSGDGHYIFIDSRREARRVFVEELGATLHTVAKDAKIQVEFDSARVRRYRLIGYENRDIADKDFRNDAIDAGEVGSGQSVTALYEIELLHEPARAGEAARDIGTVYVRYRNVETGEVEEVSHRLRAEAVAGPRRPKVEERPRLYLAACVAEFAEILRGSEHARDGDLAEVERKLRRVVKRLPLDKKVRELLWLVHRAKGMPRAE